METRLFDLSSELKLNEAERELTAHFVRQLRGEYHTGSPRRKITYRELLEVLWEQSYRLEELNQRVGLGVSPTGEALDAAANIILAVMAHQPDIGPLMQGFGKKVQAARWRKQP